MAKEKIVFSISTQQKQVSLITLLILVILGVVAGNYYWYSRKQASPTAQNNQVQQFEESSAAEIVCPQVVPTISCDAGYQVNIVPQTSVRCSYAECAPGGRAWPAAVNYGPQANTAQNEKDPNVIYPTATTAEMHFSKEGPGGKFDIFYSTGDNTGASSVPTNFQKVAKINSTANDTNPFMAQNGLTIYFSSDRSGNYDLYYATRAKVADAWGTPISMGRVFNTTQPEWSMSMNNDKTLIFFSRGTTPHLYYSKYASGKWSTPKAWEKTTAAPEDYPEVSYDGKNLYFAAKDIAGGQYYPSSKGGYDIYVSEYKNNAWQTPVNLGSTVNTTNDEIGPFVAAGQDALFFSRNGSAGSGGFDIYYSIPARINGGCGTSHNGYFSAATPPSANLCAWGTASTVTSQGDKWTWTCSGSSGGLTASCQALPRLDVFFVVHAGLSGPWDALGGPVPSTEYQKRKDAIVKLSDTLQKHGLNGSFQFEYQMATTSVAYTPAGQKNLIKDLLDKGHMIAGHADYWMKMSSNSKCVELCGLQCDLTLPIENSNSCFVGEGGIEDTIAIVKTAAGLSSTAVLPNTSFKSNIVSAINNKSYSFSRAESAGVKILNDNESPPDAALTHSWANSTMGACDSYSDFGNGNNTWYNETGNFLHPWRPNYAHVNGGDVCDNNPAGKVLFIDQVTGNWMWKADFPSCSSMACIPSPIPTFNDADFNILRGYFVGALNHLRTDQLNIWGWPQHYDTYMDSSGTAIASLDKFLTELDAYKGKTNNGQVRYVTLEDIYNDYVKWQSISGK
jgi:hypothetical protein